MSGWMNKSKPIAVHVKATDGTAMCGNKRKNGVLLVIAGGVDDPTCGKCIRIVARLPR